MLPVLKKSTLPVLKKASLPTVSETKSPSVSKLPVKSPLPSVSKLPVKHVSKLPVKPASPKSPLPSVSKLPVKPASPKSPLPSVSKLPVKPASPKSPLPTVSKLPAKPQKPVKSPVKSPQKSPVKLPLPKKSGKKDPRQHLETFFGQRNGVEGKPIEGVNYTLETLTYMTSKNRADQITSAIAQRVEGEFEVWECCGGIGGNTLSFSDNPKVQHVTVYEIDKDRRTMLQENIQMYGLDSKVSVKEESFSGVNCQEGKKQVLFFDPPWLPEGVKGQESTKENYLLSGIKIGDKTLEEWTLNSNCSVVAFKVPPGYKMNVAGYEKEEILLKNSLLVILKKRQAKNEEKNQEYTTWRNGLKKFLRYSLLPIMSLPDSALDKLVSDNAMQTWEIAFTNESFNPNVGENYEELELSGDVNLAASYVKFMMASYPEITRSQLSEFRTKYLAKGFQSKLSASLGMGPHIRSRFRTNTHILEDVFESFFGALDLVGDTEFKFGVGSGLIYNMVVELYKDVEVDWSVTKGNPKTRVKETYEGLNFIDPRPPLKEKVPEEAVENADGSTTFTIYLPPKAMTYLKTSGAKPTSNILARATENTKKIASNVAYEMAVQNLDALGLTDEFMAEFKKAKDLTNQELAPYLEKIKPRLEAEGFVDFYLTEKHVKAKPGMKQQTAKYIQLIGVDSTGRKEILSMTPEPVADVLEGKKSILQKYF